MKHHRSTRRHARFGGDFWALALMGALMAPSAFAMEDPPAFIDAVRVKIGRPLLVRASPDHSELDSSLVLLRLADGRYRSFSANQETYAVDGPTLWDRRGPRRKVLTRGEGPAACGRWLVGLLRAPTRLYGFVHEERACDYAANGQSDASWALAESADEGLSWSVPETIASGDDAPKEKAFSGLACGQPIRRGDGGLTAYCLRPRDWRTIALRAPETDFGPGRWSEWTGEKWSAPAIGGRAVALPGPFLGYSAAYLKDFGLTALLGDNAARGQNLWISQDGVRFARLAAPLLPAEGFAWTRPDARELISYVALSNVADGGPHIGAQGVLSYVYHAPDSHEPQLAMHDLWLENSSQARPPVRLALSNWRDGVGRLRTSAGPVEEDSPQKTHDRRWTHDSVLGYLLTAPDPMIESVRVEECGSQEQGYVLTAGAGCLTLGLTKRRLAGWLYAAPRLGAAPLYLCGGLSDRHGARASGADCSDRPAGYLWPD